MSKLTEKLRRVGVTEAAPMGFGFSTATRARAPQLAVVAELDAADAAAAAQAVADGADALLLDSIANGALKAVVEAAATAPVGVRAGKASFEQLEAWQKDGADFFVFEGLDTPAAVLRLDGPARLLTVDLDWPDPVWRALEALPTDGGYYRLPAGTVTFGTLLNVARALSAARRLLVLGVDTVDRDTFLALRDIGVVSVAVAPDRVAAARQTALDLPPRKRRERERLEPMLPQPTRAGAPAADHDDD